MYKALYQTVFSHVTQYQSQSLLPVKINTSYPHIEASFLYMIVPIIYQKKGKTVVLIIIFTLEWCFLWIKLSSFKVQRSTYHLLFLTVSCIFGIRGNNQFLCKTVGQFIQPHIEIWQLYQLLGRTEMLSTGCLKQSFPLSNANNSTNILHKNSTCKLRFLVEYFKVDSVQK